jgi:hypothetical protein
MPTGPSLSSDSLPQDLNISETAVPQLTVEKQDTEGRNDDQKPCRVSEYIHWPFRLPTPGSACDNDVFKSGLKDSKYDEVIKG